MIFFRVYTSNVNYQEFTTYGVARAFYENNGGLDLLMYNVPEDRTKTIELITNILEEWIRNTGLSASGALVLAAQLKDVFTYLIAGNYTIAKQALANVVPSPPLDANMITAFNERILLLEADE